MAAYRFHKTSKRMAIRSRLFDYWRELELRERRRITVAEVSRASGVHRDAIQKLLDDKTERFDKDVLDALCRYFGIAHGEAIPFLVYESSSTDEHAEILK